MDAKEVRFGPDRGGLVRGELDFEITDVCYHADAVQPGALFVAIPGTRSDGRNFVAKAIERGAVAVVVEGPFFDNLEIPQIRVSGARRALARLAAVFFAYPSREFYLAGVTGTNGKTTLTYLMEALWQAVGCKTGITGTISTRINDREIPSCQTTPESRDLQAVFALMRQDQVTRVCIEASSHALEQERVQDCEFDAAVFTNLSQDHLDYHSSMEDYFQAKKKLFVEGLQASGKKNKLALINIDDEYGARLQQELAGILPVHSYGRSHQAQSFPISFQSSITGTKARLKTSAGELDLLVPLIGEFNLMNVLAAVELALHSGMSIDEIKKVPLRSAPGRLERIETNGVHVFIDYAHTPDALDQVTHCLKMLAPKKLITVFGCGGDRDRGKRPKMGLAVAKHSDVIIVTSDNPRSEAPMKIIEDILPGLGRKKYFIEVDRAKAIALALQQASADDVVLIAGKGHEDYQIIGDEKRPFSDKAVVLRVS